MPRWSRALLAISAASSGCTLLSNLDGLAEDAPAIASPDASSSDGGDSDTVADGSTQSDRSASGYRDAVLVDNPLGYWRFGEDGGLRANDESGHGNDGFVENVTFGVPGAIAGEDNTAIRFDGTSSTISLGEKFDFAGNAPFSLEIWAKIELVDAVYRHLFIKEHWVTGDREEYGIFVQTEGFSFERWIVDSKIQAQIAPTPLIGRFSHIVATYDGAVMSLYIDGLLVASASDVRAQGPKPAPSPFTIGSRPGATSVFSGVLDEAAVYDKALSADRITAHYHASGR